MNNQLRQIIVVSSFGMTLTINALANILPINGVTTGDLSDSIPNFFVPAAYVFSIWAVIYFLVGAFVVYQALPAQKNNSLLKKIAPWFILSNIANSTWIVLWHYQLVAWSLVAMLVILAALIAIYWQLGTGRYAVQREEWFFMRLPFSVYLGWITVATVANVTSLLVVSDWDAFGVAEPVWSAIMIVVAAAVGSLMAIRHKDYAYVAVLVWAFTGIAVKFPDVLPVAITAIVMAVTVVLMLFVVPNRQIGLAAAD